jgi:RNA polymerase sigma factor (sigma-70 family)
MQRDLVERAMAGDHDAFSELARVSIDRLYVVARLILREDTKAEDATQEALLAAWRRLSGLRDPDRFEAWLHRLLVNACYREARRGRRRGSIEVHVDPLTVPEAPGATDAGFDLADRDQLERGFRRLDVDQRRCSSCTTTSGSASTMPRRSSASRRAPFARACIARSTRCVPLSRPTLELLSSTKDGRHDVEQRLARRLRPAHEPVDGCRCARP